MKDFNLHNSRVSTAYLKTEAEYLLKMVDDYIRLLDQTHLSTQGRLMAENVYKKQSLYPAQEILTDYPMTKDNNQLLDACMYIDYYQKSVWDPIATSTDNYWIQFMIRTERSLTDDIIYNSDVIGKALDD